MNPIRIKSIVKNKHRFQGTQGGNTIKIIGNKCQKKRESRRLRDTYWVSPFCFYHGLILRKLPSLFSFNLSKLNIWCRLVILRSNSSIFSSFVYLLLTFNITNFLASFDSRKFFAAIFIWFLQFLHRIIIIQKILHEEESQQGNDEIHQEKPWFGR